MLTSTSRTGGDGGCRAVAVAVVLAVLCALLLLPVPTNACMCMPMHPQTHYCSADYVIVARILRQRIENGLITYKIAIKKSYKMNDRAHDILSAGKLQTAVHDSMCGKPLHIGKQYMIAGRGSRISLCSYAEPYARMSIVERRGFAGGYRKGCPCDVQLVWGGAADTSISMPGECQWSMNDRCQTHMGACVPSRGAFNATVKPEKCHWRSSIEYNRCLNEP